MEGKSFGVIIGGEPPPPPLVVTYSPPRPRPKGLDWSKHRAPEPEPIAEAAPEPEPVPDAPPAEDDIVDAEIVEGDPLPPEVAAVANLLCATADNTDQSVVACRAVVLDACEALRTVHRRVLEDATTATQRRPSRPRKPNRDRSAPSGFEVFEKPKRRRTRGPSIDVELAEREYLAGATVAELAATHGWQVCTVRRSLKRHGTAMRDDRAKHSGGGNRVEQLRPDLPDEVRRLYVDEQLSQQQISERLGISINSIRRIMRENKVASRDHECGRGDTLGGYRARLRTLGVTPAQVRAWAVDQGFQVSDRGVIRSEVLDAFEEGHR